MPIVPALNTEAYLNYEELTTYLNSIAEAVPQLVRIFSLGSSVEGRSLWAAEVTNTNTGAASTKPAVWLDGNIHGSQFSGTTACLAVLQRLAAEHGRDPVITELLDDNVFYIVPRLAPDGAELSLTCGLCTSAGRRLGFLDGLREGLVPGDINGDGRILQMRVKDPYGQWKVSSRDDRLLVARQPGDNGGTYYRLYREGLLDRADGGPIHLRLINSKRELSHDFTADCGIVDHHYGGNGFVGPFSQVESRLVSSFLHNLSNLCLAISFRSGSGNIQITTAPAVHRRDQALMRILAHKASEITDLPVEEVAECTDFADWIYEELGVPCLRVDPWNLLREAGIEDVISDKNEEHALLATLRWLDRNNKGQGIVSWKVCEHPQLGEVEVGGWDPSLGWCNPPTGELLATICEKEINLTLCLASILPKISLGKCEDRIVGWAEPEDGGDELLPLRIISVEVRNEGYLPTWLTESLRRKDEPLISEIAVSEETELLLGHSLQEHEQLSGAVSLHLRQSLDVPFFSGSSETGRCQENWLVRGRGEVVVSVAHPRGGVVQFVSDGGSAPLLQRFKVSKPSVVIPAALPVPYVAAVASAALAAAIPAQLANLAVGLSSTAVMPGLSEAAPASKAPAIPRSAFRVPSSGSSNSAGMGEGGSGLINSDSQGAGGMTSGSSGSGFSGSGLIKSGRAGSSSGGSNQVVSSIMNSAVGASNSGAPAVQPVQLVQATVSATAGLQSSGNASSNQATASGGSEEDYTPNIRPINLTETSSSFSRSAASATSPALSRVAASVGTQPAVTASAENSAVKPAASVHSGFKPSVMGGGAKSRRPMSEPKPTLPDATSMGDFPRPTKPGPAAGGSLRKSSSGEPTQASSFRSGAVPGRDDSPLHKDAPPRSRVQPSGRVFGQPPARPGSAMPGLPGRSIENERRQTARAPKGADEGMAVSEQRNVEVKPHPLLPNRAVRQAPVPQESVPEVAAPNDEGLEGPLTPLTPQAPLLLRRSRNEE